MRDQYYDQLDAIADDVVAMTGAVRTAVADATRALLTGDATAAESVISNDKGVDLASEATEARTFELLATQQPVATDLRQLVATLRLVTDLERMGDLAVHIAEVARMRLPDLAVPPVMESTFERMAELADTMITSASRTVAERDLGAARELEQHDNELDALRTQMFRILLDDRWDSGVEAAIDVALLGRYYERIGDHAVSIARQVIFLVTGEHPA